MTTLDLHTAAWAECKFEDLLEYIQPTDYIVDSTEYGDSFPTPVLTAGKSFIKGYTNEQHGIFQDLPAIIFDDFTTASQFVTFQFKVKSSAMKILVGRCDLVNLKFLYHCMQANPIRSDTHKRYWISVYAKKPVLLPPLRAQERIIAKIEELFSELDKGIEYLKIARKQLKVYRQAVLKYAFEGKLTEKWRDKNKDKLETADQLLERIRKEREQQHEAQLAEWRNVVKEWEQSGKNGRKPSKPRKPKGVDPINSEELERLPTVPEGWQYGRLGSTIQKIEAGKSFKCDEREPENDEVGVAKVSAVSWGEYDELESKTCSDSARVDEALFIRSGDFLFSRANTIELVGACVIARNTTKNVMLSDKTLRLILHDRYKRYFLQYLRSQTGRNEIMRRSTGNQESMRNIGQDRIRSIIVPICSESEILEIDNLLAARFTVADSLESEIDAQILRSRALRQSILKRTFSGQLIDQDPDDEPASELLARIRAETAEKEKAKKVRKKTKQKAKRKDAA